MVSEVAGVFSVLVFLVVERVFWRNTGSAAAVSPSAELLFWVSLPHDLTFPFGKIVGAVGSPSPGKRYGGASINPGP